MSEIQSVPSLSELPNWGGSYPAAHEYSTLEGLDKSNGELDEAMLAADALLQRWDGKQFAGLYLYGTPGTGKTHFAVGLGRALALTGVDVAYLKLPGIYAASYDHPREYSQQQTNESFNAWPEHIFSPIKIKEYKPISPGRSALILDEYQPDHRKKAIAAIHAAEERGGLVVITSNYPDPFKLIEAPVVTEVDEEKLALRAFLDRTNPDGLQQLDAQRAAAEKELTGSLRSRIAAGFKFIKFTGPDRRLETSFWA